MPHDDDTARSILTPKQREEYADMLDIGVPEDVIAEFLARLDAHMLRWSRVLRRAALSRARESVILPRDDDEHPENGDA